MKKTSILILVLFISFIYLNKTKQTLKAKVSRMSVTKIYFARPGVTTDNYIQTDGSSQIAGRWSSSPDTSLSEQGKESASKVAAAFKDIKFDKVYCTPTTRALETAKEILQFNEKKTGVEIISTPDLDEMRLGKLEGKSSAEIIEIFINDAHYYEVDIEENFPNLWEKRKGGPLKHGNDAIVI